MERKYEVLVLLRPDLKEEETAKIIAHIESTLAGKVVKKEVWGKKKITYKMNNFEEAIYYLYFVETLPIAIQNLKEYFLINKKDVLRSLILKHDKKWPFEMRTAKELKFVERRPKNLNGKRFNKKSDKNYRNNFEKKQQF